MTIRQFNPSLFNHQTAICSGYTYHYVDEGNKDGIPILLLHGFPDLWYGWRYQIEYLASLGYYRVLVPDLLGYGKSSKPRFDTQYDPATETWQYNKLNTDYTPKKVARHLTELLDHLKLEKAVWIGHDWGSGIVSRAGWHFPERVHAAIAIGNPFRPISKRMVSIEEFVKENPAFQYFHYFASQIAASEMDSMDRAYYIQNLKEGGFYGPLAYYKSFDISYREDLHLAGSRFTVPALLLIVNNDPILTPEYCKNVPKDYFDDLEVDEIEYGEHWVLTQNPDMVNKKIGNYLERLFGSNGGIRRKSASTTRDLRSMQYRHQHHYLDAKLHQESHKEQPEEPSMVREQPRLHGYHHSSHNAHTQRSHHHHEKNGNSQFYGRSKL
ncbi:hypothetical protein BX616_001668 [Lobosporangium transversale]|nr:hypothetical protein BX616_001668 [Lobosporangium transversale]